MFLAREPETGVPNLSFHRSMYVSDQELRCRLAPRHHLTLYHEKAEQMGRHAGGGDAARARRRTPFLAAAAPLPYDVDELEVAAKLAGHADRDAAVPAHRSQVPASTEIVIEGRFLPNERRPEGPFGEFMGYYVPVGRQRRLRGARRVACGRTRSSTASCAASAEEVLTLELSVAANIYQRISAVLPGIVDVTCQPFVLHTVVKIRQQYEGHARQVLLAVFGAEPTWAKTCTVVDEDVDIYDMNDVMWAVLTRSRPGPRRAWSLPEIAVVLSRSRTRITGAGSASTRPRRSPGATSSSASACPGPTQSISTPTSPTRDPPTLT